MENLYNDELLPDNFEVIAKAYSKSLKDKGFVFVRLEEEEFDLLLQEMYVIIAKMRACLQSLHKLFDSKQLLDRLTKAQSVLEEKFGKKKPHKFVCVEKENLAFLSLISLASTLVVKLMLLSVKSGEIEICNQISVSLLAVFAESFSCEGFRVDLRD